MATENVIPIEIPRKEAVNLIRKEASHSVILNGWRKNLIHSRIKFSILKLAWKCYKNPLDVITGLKYMVRLRKKFLGDYELKKIVRIGGKYYTSLYSPGWKSGNFNRFMITQLNDYKPVNKKIYRFHNVIVAITKKCSLQCEHCFEWESLNKKETLSTSQFVEMVAKLQKQGVSEIQFSGGEPMLKVERILEILESADTELTTFWIDTSGFKFTHKNARLLKEAGLTGVFVSLDHYDPEVHNKFRGFKDAFYWAQTAVKNAIERDLAVSLSLCITRDFATRENLMSYMKMARNMNVAFVQFLEPKAVGHYSGKDVLLLPEHIEIIEDVYREFNFSSGYLDYPLITYHGYYQRRNGCFSGGYKGFYVDTDGDINPCPFCQNKSGNLLEDDLTETLAAVKDSGCATYTRFSL